MDGAVFEESNGFETEGSVPLVAMDEQGNGLVAWTLSSGMSTRALARRYTAGVGWSDIELVLQDGYPTSVALRNGVALVAVVGPTVLDAGGGDRTAGIYVARFAAGGWSTQSLGVTSTGWWQEPYTSPPVVVLGQSAALVTWIDANSGYVAASVFATSWQPAQLFGSATRDPTAAMLPSGTFAVAYAQEPGATSADPSLLLSAWGAMAGWEPAVTVSEHASGPVLAACAGGRPHALWSGPDGFMHAEQLPSGTWSAGEMVVPYDKAHYQGNQRLAADLAGNALVAWTSSFPTSSPGLWCASAASARYYVEGVGWQGITPLDQGQSDRSYGLVDLAMAPDGDAWALWQGGPCDESSQEIWARPFHPASGWGEPMQLTSSDGCIVRDGTVAMGGNRSLAAWSQPGTNGIVVRWLE